MGHRIIQPLAVALVNARMGAGHLLARRRGWSLHPLNGLDPEDEIDKEQRKALGTARAALAFLERELGVLHHVVSLRECVSPQQWSGRHFATIRDGRDRAVYGTDEASAI